MNLFARPRVDAPRVTGRMGWAVEGQRAAGKRLLDAANAAIQHGEWGAAVTLAEAGRDLDPDSPEVAAVLQEALAGAERARRPDDGTRRRITIMFCDLVGSCEFASALDPEDTRAVLRAFQQSCATVIRRYDGHIARFIGDGVLVYFGYPRAHEDDPVRAVLSGLSIVETVDALRPGPETGDLRLAVRVGIHTGEAVVAAMGSDEWVQTDEVVGETPNIAARIQALTEPDTVVISGDTLRLVKHYVDVEALGVRDLKGIRHPVELYRVLGELPVDQRFAPSSDERGEPIGRAGEKAVIRQAWQDVPAGVQGLLITGDPGIGKSRLAAYARSHVLSSGGQERTFQCSPYHTGSPLHPVVHRLQRELESGPGAGDRFRRLKRLLTRRGLVAHEDLFLFSSLLSIPWPQKLPLPDVPVEQIRERTFGALLAWIDALAARLPLLLVVEDLHWADTSTLELLARIADRESPTAILLLATTRERDQQVLGSRARHLALGPLDRPECEQIVDQLSTTDLPAATRQQIVERSDGVPLYLKELTQMLSEECARTGFAQTVAIPPTLHHLLVARLDMYPEERELAQVLATVGQPAAPGLLQRLVDLSPSELQRRLMVLVNAGLLRSSGAPPYHYEFEHHLVREAAYELQLRARRRQVHARVALALEGDSQSAAEEHPEVLAYHFEHAGQPGTAAEYLLRAGLRVAGLAAHVEAIEFYRRALDACSQTATVRDGLEMDVQSGLAASLLASRGYTSDEVSAVYARLRELSAPRTGTQHEISALYGLWAYYHVKGDNVTSLELAERLATAASEWDRSIDLLAANAVLGYQHLRLGRLSSARQLLESGRSWQASDGPGPFPHHPGIGATVNLALVLWLHGDSDAARETLAEAVAAAEALEGPTSHFTRAFTHAFAAEFFHIAGRPEIAGQHAQRTVDISAEHGFASWVGAGMIHLAVANALTVDAPANIPIIEYGLTSWRGAGAAASLTQFTLGLAHACQAAGRVDEGLRAADDALATVQMTDERFVEAELHRLRGELLMRASPPDPAAALAAMEMALDVARRQGARAFEIRAQTSLSQLRRDFAVVPVDLIGEPYLAASRPAVRPRSARS
jgi:class 3 adenylate cyclase/tetratricopeptide (TPR) repeat protein